MHSSIPTAVLALLSVSMIVGAAAAAPSSQVAQADGPTAGVAAAGSTPPTASVGANDTAVHTATSDETHASGETLSSSDTAVSPADRPTVTITKRVNRTPETLGRVRIEYVVALPSSVTEFNATLTRLTDAEVTAADGFSEAAPGVWRVDAADEGATTATLTYEVDANVSRSSGSNFDTVETADWAFLDPKQLGVNWLIRYSTSSPTPAVRERATVDTGYAADPFAFAGPVETDRSSANQTFVLVVPDAARLDVERRTVFDRLERAADALRIGDLDPNVTAFAPPDPMRGGGGAAGGDVLWVRDRDVDDDDLLLHEYTHTRQAWTDSDVDLQLDSTVEWLTEGSADYFSGYLAWQVGDKSTDAFRRYVATDREADAVLQDADTDTVADKNYYKGRRVLAALDVRIRAHTGGNETLADVFAQLNAAEEPTVGYRDFRELVVARTNASTGTWLDRYVTTSAAPPIPDDIAAAYGTVNFGVENLTLSPATVRANETVAQSFAATVSDASDDGDTDTYTLELPAGARLDGNASVTVTDATGHRIQIESGPTVATRNDTAALSFAVAPDDGDTTTLSVRGTLTVAYPATATTGTVTLTVADSTRGTATAETTVAIEGGIPSDAVYDPGTAPARYDADGDGRIGIEELAAAAEAFARDDLTVTALVDVVRAFAAS